jgi:hypothetical protein
MGMVLGAGDGQETAGLTVSVSRRVQLHVLLYQEIRISPYNTCILWKRTG